MPKQSTKVPAPAITPAVLQQARSYMAGEAQGDMGLYGAVNPTILCESCVWWLVAQKLFTEQQGHALLDESDNELWDAAAEVAEAWENARS
jgi:hypothetical protein